MASWKLAKSLDVLREQINDMFPSRVKSSDGTIGDVGHSVRASDHNPNEDGVVCALDITHDPKHGMDSERMAETLRLSRDPRIQYIISNKKIANADIDNFAWRRYSGSNAHDHHFHVSVKQKESAWNNTKKWDLSRYGVPVANPVDFVPLPRTLKEGSTGALVKILQTLLGVKPADGKFGPQTKAAVQKFQKDNGLVQDGIVGSATWGLLKPKEK